MVDTRREWDATLALLPDNGAGGVSAQDLRDAVFTLLPNLGIIYISTAIETILGDTNWTKALGTTTSVVLDAFTTSDNRLTYSGTPDRRVLVFAFCSTSTAAANKTLQIGIYHYDASGPSGSVLAHSPIPRYHSATDQGGVATIGTCLMETDDYVELHIKNSTASNATIENMVLLAVGMPRLV